MRRNISKSLLEATQSTLDKWAVKIREAVQLKEQGRDSYDEKRQKLLAELLDAHEKGLSARELAKITGISHSTIARWVREAKERQQNGEEKAQNSGSR